jgi:hypothetical protein
MQTPSHAIVNYAILSHFAPRQTWAIVVGAVLPDLPMLVLVVWARLNGIPGQQVWSEVYWQPFWQDFTHYFHSLPISIGLALIAHYSGIPWLKYLSLSLILHMLGDLPLHHDDAHRHFLPLSQFRFVSPVSYWDRSHNAIWGALAENLAVLSSIITIFPTIGAGWIKGGLILYGALEWIVYALFL